MSWLYPPSLNLSTKTSYISSEPSGTRSNKVTFGKYPASLAPDSIDSSMFSPCLGTPTGPAISIFIRIICTLHMQLTGQQAHFLLQHINIQQKLLDLFVVSLHPFYRPLQLRHPPGKRSHDLLL